MGNVQTAVEQANLADPRSETEKVTRRVQSQINAASNKIATGEQAIDGRHDQNLDMREQYSHDGFAELAHIKAEHFRASIAAAANDNPSAAEWSYNMLGGSLYNTAKNIETVGDVGSEHIHQFVAHVSEAQENGATIWDAIKYGASQSYPGFIAASQAWADQKVNEVADQLTPNQQAYYKAAMFEGFAGIAIGGDDNGSMGAAKQKLLDEEGLPDGENIAKLLRQAAGQNRTDFIDHIGNFNRSRGRVNY